VLAEKMKRENFLSFLSIYFFRPQHRKAVIGFRDNRISGIIVGHRDSLYPDLIVIQYFFTLRLEDAESLLEGFIYHCSVDGYRWVGLRLPIKGLCEHYLRKKGWREANLPSFWTRYRMLKELR
ncbi:hypothetical protein CW702_01235, partial [Candidatus Bathyarchaeota archaeon]